jgi:bacteriochlorophyllide a dehydrogenase
MTDTTQAVVISEPGKVGLQPVTLRERCPDDVVVQTAYTSISAGTERMLLAGQMPHPMLQLPVIPGYETVGRVVEVGPEANPALLNRWVYVGGAHCYQGVNPAWGGQSATILTPAEKVIPLDGVDPKHGVMLALSATALHGVDLLHLTPGDRVLVLGQGPVGQLAARLAQQQGAWVAVTDRNPNRLETAVANQVINVVSESLTDAVAEPVSVVVEATGSMEALAGSLPLLAKGGTLMLLGYYSKLELPYMPLFLKEARILTSREWAPGDLNRCRDMIAAGQLDVGTLLTHEMGVDDIAAAYDVALNDENCLKVVIEWKTI